MIGCDAGPCNFLSRGNMGHIGKKNHKGGTDLRKFSWNSL